MRALSVLSAVILLCLGLALPTQAAPGRTHVVKVGPGLEFHPKIIYIHVGDTVKWVFTGRGVHSVRKGLDPARPCKGMGEFNSGPKRKGQTFSLTFTASRRVVYMSDIKDDCYQGMSGEVHVEE